MSENGEIKYSNEYDGIEINTFANENKTTISNILAGKYEITVSNEILDLDTITLANSDSMTISKENGKYYITITPATRDSSGDIIIKHIYNNHYGYIYFSKKYSLFKK